MPQVYIPEPLPQQERPRAERPYAYAAPQAVRGNGWATGAFVFGVLAVILTPIPLFVGLILGGGAAVIAAILAIVGLTRVFMGRGGIARVIFAALLVVGAFSMISVGGGIIW